MRSIGVDALLPALLEVVHARATTLLEDVDGEEIVLARIFVGLMRAERLESPTM